MPEEDEEKQEKEYQALLAIFMAIVDELMAGGDGWELLEDLMMERAEIGIQHAFDGFGMSFDEALELIRNADDLTDEQRVKRDILIAAVDNIADFAVAEEYQMAMDLPDFDEYGDELEEDEWEEIEGVFEMYNKRHAATENFDIEYSMIIAAYVSAIASTTVLTYMTQGDHRVRPWHRQYEGFSAPKSRFPAWLVPPIEHQCRCFLVEDTMASLGSMKAWSGGSPEMPEWFNPTFKESVAFGGRIFSDEHPYFQIEGRHAARLREIAQRIKSKYSL